MKITKIIFIILLIIVFLFIFYLSNNMFKYQIELGKDKAELCFEQCNLQNMDYKQYTPRSYAPALCSCITKDGIIKTIYQE